MANENGEWMMHGLDWNSPYRIRTWQELINWINEVGFLPLFANEVEGFSAEEHVSPNYWWTGNREQVSAPLRSALNRRPPGRLAPVGMARNNSGQPSGCLREVL